MNHLKIGLAALAATLLLASCNDNNNPPKPPLPDEGTYTGTVSVAPGTENAFTLGNVAVKFDSNDAGTSADIEMLQVKFAEAMPVALDITIPGATLTKTADGYSISGDEIIPIAMGGPNERFKITDLEGSVSAETLSVSFECMTFPVKFIGTAE
jgi:hypothetical protein